MGMSRRIRKRFYLLCRNRGQVVIPFFMGLLTPGFNLGSGKFFSKNRLK